MITFTVREITPEEKDLTSLRSPGLFKEIENFIMLMILIISLLLIPFLVVDHFRPISSRFQGFYCITAVGIALAVLVWILKRGEVGSSKISDKNSDQVEVISVSTKRAVKREDFDDFGIAFYIDVTHMGEQKTLFLWGQYLDELEYDGKFPNTEFEITRLVNNDEFIAFKISGTYFKEERTVPAFEKEKWKNGEYPVNGELLNLSIGTITA